MKTFVMIMAAILAFLLRPMAHAQSVSVTIQLDTNQISAGSSTTLRVFAQVVPALRPDSERIFSWYIDVLNANGAVASANWGSMQRTASDRDPQTSSSGTSDGSNRRNIYDTFLNAPTGIGVSNKVELLSVPVTGATAGLTRFRVQAASGGHALSDFLVNSHTNEMPYFGGDYSSAVADLDVVGFACSLHVQIAHIAGSQYSLTFIPCPGFNHTVESLEQLGGTWQDLPGAPHNSGQVTITAGGSKKFYRVRAN